MLIFTVNTPSIKASPSTAADGAGTITLVSPYGPSDALLQQPYSSSMQLSDIDVDCAADILHGNLLSFVQATSSLSLQALLYRGQSLPLPLFF